MSVDITPIIICPRYKHDQPAAVVPAESRTLDCKPSTLFETTDVTTNLCRIQITNPIPLT